MGLQDLAKVIERAWGMRWSLLLNHSFSLQAKHSSAPLFAHSFSSSEYQCKYKRYSSSTRTTNIMIVYKIAFQTATNFVNWKLNRTDAAIQYKVTPNPRKRANPSA